MLEVVLYSKREEEILFEHAKGKFLSIYRLARNVMCILQQSCMRSYRRSDNDDDDDNQGKQNYEIYVA